MTLPLPRAASPAPYHISMICLGNICRSPIAEVVFRQRLVDADLATAVVVDSAGLGGWHVGQPMDPRSQAVLREAGYAEGEVRRHRAQQIERDWFASRDLVLAMDGSNLDGLRSLAPAGDAARIALFGTYGGNIGEIPDPYYGGPEGFAHVLRLVERAAAGLASDLAELLGSSRPSATPSTRPAP
ncbi:low molecular weight protein-tyrosine-phosphatase [Actinopolymorpha alba]|uniref:low molecular weight protein-tyrosine-phosphatase n=1 Tax=Actinopolymorpha alba TaxID=533267 RepID=UPI0003780938|nr:low molecular weight protein-tyrosine-phosphatase [Actinopolymorpha alba]